jgi:hypothetical protein
MLDCVLPRTTKILAVKPLVTNLYAAEHGEQIMSDVVEGPIEWDAEDEYLANYGLTSVDDQKVLDALSAVALEDVEEWLTFNPKWGKPEAALFALGEAELFRRGLKRKP